MTMRMGMHLYHTPQLRQSMNCSECGTNSLGDSCESVEEGAIASTPFKEPRDEGILDRCGKCGKFIRLKKES